MSTIVSLDPAYTFTVTGDRTLTAVFASMAPQEYAYTGNVAEVTLYPGIYKLEAWGAEGGYRSSATYAGKGGYSVGTLTLTETTQVFVRAGGSGNTGKTSGGFNGGGRRGTYNGGGGASDIRIGVDDLNHRVIVAGGGGSDGAAAKGGGYGGGTAGQSRTESYGTGGFGGTQTGVSNSSWQTSSPPTSTTAQAGAYAGFGFGGNGIAANSGYGGAGGGGWYGGSGSMPDGSGDDDRGGGGGSGFVWTGANAPAGFGLTEAHYLTKAQTIDGSKPFTSPTGTTETGHSGNGYVRITPVAFYVVTVVSEDAAKGTVSGGGSYEGGAQATVSASPATGYKLSGWYENGAQVSADKSYTFTVNGNRTLTARFAEAAVYTIAASIDPTGTGTVTGAGQYTEGETVTLVATAGGGYEFSGWQEGGQTVSTGATYTFTATGDRALVAAFEMHTGRLPTGYTEVEYVHAAQGKTCCMRPGVVQSAKLVVIVDIEPIFDTSEEIPGYIFISYYSNHTFTAQWTKKGILGEIGYSSTSAPKVINNDPTQRRIVLKMDASNRTASIDSGAAVSVANGSALYSSSANLFLPGSNMAASKNPVKLYSCKIYNGGTIVRDLVPCTNQSGVAGMYDLIESNFYPSVIEPLIAGPAV